MNVTRQFVNEHAREIKITIEGPSSLSENTLTEMEARHLRDALNEALPPDEHPSAPDMTVSAETVEALQAVVDAWRLCQSVCEHRNPDRDAEGQGPICEHEENQSGMEWCSPDSCPLLAI